MAPSIDRTYHPEHEDVTATVVLANGDIRQMFWVVRYIRYPDFIAIQTANGEYTEIHSAIIRELYLSPQEALNT